MTTKRNIDIQTLWSVFYLNKYCILTFTMDTNYLLVKSDPHFILKKTIFYNVNIHMPKQPRSREDINSTSENLLVTPLRHYSSFSKVTTSQTSITTNKFCLFLSFVWKNSYLWVLEFGTYVSEPYPCFSCNSKPFTFVV